MKENITTIQKRIEAAALKNNRNPFEVKLIAVTKTVTAEMVQKAIDSGITRIGENYIQEARNKFTAIGNDKIEWHFIGHLQRNKAKYAVKMFDLIHSVDSLRLAKAIHKEAAKINKVQPILIQINIGEEETKSGIFSDQVHELAAQIAHLSNVSIKGLMTLPPFFNAPDKVRPFFNQLKALRDEISALNLKGVEMKELSMGMTGDFEVAIEAGATYVRIGTALFGVRS